MGKIYTGRFLSEREVEYRVNIYREGVDAAVPADLVFGEEPAEIEWNEVDKIEPVQGSALTLTLLSETDRQYTDLYTVETGEVWAEVLREGKLYWTGTLDTELYEEPYSYKQDYEVQFTFSDFGTLERLKWTERGVMSLKAIVGACLEAVGLSYDDMRQRVSTSTDGTQTDLLPELYLNCENFFDEDDEPMSMREVLEAVLQPFALRLVQKGGHAELFDLNALYADTDTQQVEWMSDDAELGADVVYNSVKVTFSPYADTTMMDAGIDEEDILQEGTEAYEKAETNNYYIYKGSGENGGFLLHVDKEGLVENLPFELPETPLGKGYVFREEAEFSGSNEAGVVWGYRDAYSIPAGNSIPCYMFASGSENHQETDLQNKIAAGTVATSDWTTQPFMVCSKMLVPEIMETPYTVIRKNLSNGNGATVTDQRGKYQLKISLDLLFDPRYNPFETADENNDQEAYDQMQHWCSFAYVPVQLLLKDADGNVLYHYSNRNLVMSSKYQYFQTYRSNNGMYGWQVGKPTAYTGMFLAYYDTSNRRENCGLGGWQTNKQCIGSYADELPAVYEKLGTGQLIDLPPCGGWLELSIQPGVKIMDYKRDERDIYSKIRWMAYKDVKVEIVDRYGNDIDTDDQEDSAWLNRSAQEDLEIDTTVGTRLELTLTPPTARGVLLTKDLAEVSSFQRAGVADRLERLLIGTAYSQYAERKTTLSGTMALLPELRPLTDASTEGRFTLLSEVQQLGEETSEVTMVQFGPDSYEGIEYE